MKIEQIEILIQNLPQTPGIYGRDEFLNSVVLALLIPVGDEYHFVFHKRHNSIRQGGEICFPGGCCDPVRDGSLEQTAIRETTEEMGIPEEKIRIIGRLDTLVMPMRAIVDAFVGVADVPFEAIKPNQKEVESIFATPISFFESHKPEIFEIKTVMQSRFIDEQGREVVLFPAREMNLPEKYHTQWESGRYKVYVYRLPEGILWGLTARIVRDIVNKLTPAH